MNKLSVVLATRNEEANISACLESVKAIADEIIVFDEYSSDKTRQIAKKYDARVFKYMHRTNFHQTKQKAIAKATGDWILQLDADERVSEKLSEEIKNIINLPHEKLKDRLLIKSDIKEAKKDLVNKINLFKRHQSLIEEREGKLGKSTGEVVAFFIPRLNFFLGSPLRHAGVYPDGVIRLFKKGKARLPAKTVHELMQAEGEVGWLFNDLEHHESPTFKRYFDRANRYTDLTAKEYKRKNVKLSYLNMINFSFIKPTTFFITLYIRHLGYLDGIRGFLWSMFSAFHFPMAYFKYWQSVKK